MSKNMWEVISRKLRRDYDITTALTKPDLGDLVKSVASQLSQGLESVGCFTYAPLHQDWAFTVEYRVGLEVAEGSALVAARRFGDMLKAGGGGVVSAVAPLGPSTACSAIVARALQGTLGVLSGQMHFFLQGQESPQEMVTSRTSTQMQCLFTRTRDCLSSHAL